VFFFCFLFFREVVERAPPAKGEGLLGNSTPGGTPFDGQARRRRGRAGDTASGIKTLPCRYPDAA
jgi:hypothetical protein